MCTPPPGALGWWPIHDQLSLPRGIEVLQRQIEPKARGSASSTVHSEFLQLDVGRNSPVLRVSERFRFSDFIQADEQRFARLTSNERCDVSRPGHGPFNFWPMRLLVGVAQIRSVRR